jgi:hypothetical protein
MPGCSTGRTESPWWPSRPAAAWLAGRGGEALIATEPRADLVEAFVAGGGPRYAEAAMCYAKHEEDARKIAHKYFRWWLTGWPVMAELANTEGFAAVSKSGSPEAVAKQLSGGPSAELQLQTIERYVQAGFDHIIRVQVGPEQQAFIEFFERQLAPALGRSKAAQESSCNCPSASGICFISPDCSCST